MAGVAVGNAIERCSCVHASILSRQQGEGASLAESSHPNLAHACKISQVKIEQSAQSRCPVSYFSRTISTHCMPFVMQAWSNPEPCCIG